MKMTKEHKSREFPHTFVLLTVVLLAAWVLTYLIPAGQYAREVNEAGLEVVIADQFSYIESNSVSFFELPKYIVKGCTAQAAIILMILMAGGAFHVVIKTGCFHGVVGLAARKFSKKDYVFIPLMMLIFALIALTQSGTIFVAFVPIMVLMATGMGFDKITGAAIVVLGCAVGYSTGMLHPQTTLIAQGLAELPRYSGLGFRAFCFIIYFSITAFLVVRYAHRVKANHSLSPVCDMTDGFGTGKTDADELMNAKMSGRQFLCLGIMISALAFLIYGCINWKWSYTEISAIFFTLAIIDGIAAGFSLNEICESFTKGAANMVSMIFVIGIAKAVSDVLADANVLDTIVHATAIVLDAAPVAFKGILMFWANIIINLPLVSSSGQAQVVMPIFIPVADMVGLTRQTAVLAYNFGDGFCNYILPWSGALMANIAVANIPYDRWMRFMAKVFAVWVVVGSVLMFIAQTIKFGPF